MFCRGACPALAAGDLVRLAGTVAEFFEMTQVVGPQRRLRRGPGERDRPAHGDRRRRCRRHRVDEGSGRLRGARGHDRHVPRGAHGHRVLRAGPLRADRADERGPPVPVHPRQRAEHGRLRRRTSPSWRRARSSSTTTTTTRTTPSPGPRRAVPVPVRRAEHHQPDVRAGDTIDGPDRRAALLVPGLQPGPAGTAERRLADPADPGRVVHVRLGEPPPGDARAGRWPHQGRRVQRPQLLHDDRPDVVEQQRAVRTAGHDGLPRRRLGGRAGSSAGQGGRRHRRPSMPTSSASSSSRTTTAPPCATSSPASTPVPAPLPYTELPTGTIGGDAIKVTFIYRHGDRHAPTARPFERPRLHRRPPLHRQPQPPGAHPGVRRRSATGERFTAADQPLQVEGFGVPPDDPDLERRAGQLQRHPHGGGRSARRPPRRSRERWLGPRRDHHGRPQLVPTGGADHDARGAGLRRPDRRVRRRRTPTATSSTARSATSTTPSATASFADQVTGVTEWHVNADEAPLFDYNDDGPRRAR